MRRFDSIACIASEVNDMANDKMMVSRDIFGIFIQEISRRQTAVASTLM